MAEVLDVCDETVRRLARSGAIPAIRVGRTFRFDIDAVVAALSAGAPAPETSAAAVPNFDALDKGIS